MGNYGFRYTVEFKGEEVEQLLVAPDKESAQKAFDYHTKVAEKNPEKIKIISTEVEEIPEEDIIKEEEVATPTSTATH
jgi:hypothetical protein